MTISEIRIVVDHDGAVPPFEQVKQQVTDAVDSGALAPGDRLPPVRALAAEVGLAANTVARAYKELEAAGVVATRGRAGTVVLGRGAERASREAALAYASAARSLGLEVDEAVVLLRNAWPNASS
ncbi:MAG: GntR family transcriptional regulator [Nocardioides sp.]|uniref:GntR family transcriptional regulator n=1 Tax=Nocardioides sp. TaxID=35761 RepID=UPI003F0BC624